MSLTMKWLPPVLIGILITGCATPNQSYQPAGRANVKPSNLYEDNAAFPKLCAIEFDEQGDIWKTAQYRAAKSFIKTGKRPLLVVFIHG